MLLLVPLVYLVVALASVQAGAFAAEGAARQAARVFVQAPDEASGRASAQWALQFALADHGVDTSASLGIECRPKPSTCLTRQGFVTVSVALSVPLPLVPPVIVGDFPLSVPLRATATEQVSRFWGAR
jgi:hypothetical protein